MSVRVRFGFFIIRASAHRKLLGENKNEKILCKFTTGGFVVDDFCCFGKRKYRAADQVRYLSDGLDRRADRGKSFHGFAGDAERFDDDYERRNLCENLCRRLRNISRFAGLFQQKRVLHDQRRKLFQPSANKIFDQLLLGK